MRVNPAFKSDEFLKSYKGYNFWSPLLN
jgi:hypothetical protein